MRTYLVASLIVAVLAVAGVPVTASGQSSVPECTVPDVSLTEGPGVGFDATCDAPLPRDLDFRVTTADGTAVAPDDYVALDGIVTTIAGRTEIAIGIEVVGDTIDEPDETLTVTLDDPSGTVTFAKPTGTITIVDDDEPSGGACIVLSETSVSVTGLASTPQRAGFASFDRLTVSNCGDSDVDLNARGTNATGTSGTWQLTNASTDSTCELGPDVFRAEVTLWWSDGSGTGTPLTTADTTVLDRDLNSFSLAPAAVQEFSPNVELPCVGSVGLGEPMTMEITLTAVVP